ncbi:hypothetical protein FKM82_007110 [Ascaphus truei]
MTTCPVRKAEMGWMAEHQFVKTREACYTRVRLRPMSLLVNLSWLSLVLLPAHEYLVLPWVFRSFCSWHAPSRNNAASRCHAVDPWKICTF